MASFGHFGKAIVYTFGRKMNIFGHFGKALAFTFAKNKITTELTDVFMKNTSKEYCFLCYENVSLISIFSINNIELSCIFLAIFKIFQLVNNIPLWQRL